MAGRLFPMQLREWGFQIRQSVSHVGAAVGTGSHAGVANLLTEKMKTGRVTVSSESKDRGEAAFKEALAYGIEWDTVTPRSDIGVRQIIKTINAYAQHVAPRFDPVAVEQHLTQTTAAGNTLSGHIDLAVNAIRDLKTGKFEGGNIVQYGAYSLLLRANGGESRYVAEDYIKRVKVDDPQPPPKETIYDVNVAEAAAANVIKRLERDYTEFMETGNPGAFLANPNSILCGERLCGAWGTEFCREHKK